MNLPDVSSSKTYYKSVLYNYWKATVNKKITAGKALYLLRGCSMCFAQCASSWIANIMRKILGGVVLSILLNIVTSGKQSVKILMLASPEM